MVSSLRPRTTHASVLFLRRIVRPTLTVKWVPLGVLTQFRGGHLALLGQLPFASGGGALLEDIDSAPPQFVQRSTWGVSPYHPPR